MSAWSKTATPRWRGSSRLEIRRCPPSKMSSAVAARVSLMQNYVPAKIAQLTQWICEATLSMDSCILTKYPQGILGKLCSRTLNRSG
eukprot:1724081-Pyramimonas_sp.AAC.1